MKYTFLIFFCIAATISSFAQTKGKDVPLGGSLQLKNMHLWRGQEVTDEVTLATDIHFIDKSKTFKLGLWGGAGINGGFKEIDYYLNFSKSGFTFALWDIYNFSPEAHYNNHQAFNYSARETGHFFDASLAYRFQGKFPLRLYWATVIFGRDRGSMNEKNRYSTYIEMSYPVLQNKNINLEAGIAGAFALDKGKEATGKTSKAHFYGDTPGIVNIHLTFSKDLNLWGYTLPITVMPMWNPEKNYANIQVAFNLISL